MMNNNNTAIWKKPTTLTCTAEASWPNPGERKLNSNRNQTRDVVLHKSGQRNYSKENHVNRAKTMLLWMHILLHQRSGRVRGMEKFGKISLFWGRNCGIYQMDTDRQQGFNWTAPKSKPQVKGLFYMYVCISLFFVFLSLHFSLGGTSKGISRHLPHNTYF